MSTSDIVQEIQSNKKVIVSYKVMNFDRDLLFAPVIAAKLKYHGTLVLLVGQAHITLKNDRFSLMDGGLHLSPVSNWVILHGIFLLTPEPIDHIKR